MIKRNSCRDAGTTSEHSCGIEGASTGVDADARVGNDAESAGSRTDAQGAGHPGSDASSSPGPGTPPDACSSDRRLTARKGLNLYLLVDDSLSVVLQPAWNSLTLAISAFVDDPGNTGVGFGIGYYGISCNGSDYMTPTVRVAPLPDPAQAIKSTYPLPISGKALTPAVTGALSYARSLVFADADRDTSMILVTDGIADPLCGSTEASAAQAIAAGFQDPASVRTYVIALGAGPTLLDPANIIDLSPLDALAAAGGTKQARRIEVNLSTNSELTTALDDTVTAALPCAYKIPSDVDPSRAALEWQSGTDVAPWPRVSSAAACGDQPGCFVRKEAPTYLELCPKACAMLKATPHGTVFLRTCN